MEFLKFSLLTSRHVLYVLQHDRRCSIYLYQSRILVYKTLCKGLLILQQSMVPIQLKHLSQQLPGRGCHA